LAAGSRLQNGHDAAFRNGRGSAPGGDPDRSCQFSGTPEFPIYVDYLPAASGAARAPVILLHGACNTGSCYLVTPDGRPGWAHDFSEAGFDVYVVDWPGHGRSPMRPGYLSLSTADVRDAVAELLKDIGPAVILAHSAAGPIAWSLAESQPDLVLAVVGVSPGPPANLVEETPRDIDAADDLAAHEDRGLPIYAPETELFFVDEAFVAAHWFAGSQAPAGAVPSFFRSVVPESPRIINERFNVSGQGLGVDRPDIVARRPILIVTGDSDPRHPRSLDARTASLFGADFWWLADEGVTGNGHMLMADLNSREIALRVSRWLTGVLAPDGRSDRTVVD
jgi:pimeloyl-ACP methyl ester carboxylesterase